MQPVNNNIPIAPIAPAHEEVSSVPSLIKLCLRTLSGASHTKKPITLTACATGSEAVSKALLCKETDLFILFNKSPDDCYNFISYLLRNDPHSLLAYGDTDRAPFLHATITYFSKHNRNDLLLRILPLMKKRPVLTASEITAVATDILEQKREKTPCKNLLQMLLVQTNVSGESPLELALKTASSEVIEELLTMLPENALEIPDIHRKTPLAFAFENRSYNSLLPFQSRGIEIPPTRENLTTIIVSENYKHAEFLISKLTKEQLLERDLETQKTLLHIAAECGCPKTFALLLKLCPSIHNARDMNTKTVLEIALINKRFMNARLLIKELSKEQLSEKDPVTGSTAFHVAAASASASILQAIMDKCPVIHTIKNHNQELPFIHAYEAANHRAVGALVTKLTNKELLNFKCKRIKGNIIHYLISIDLIKPLEEIILRCPEIRNERNEESLTPLQMALSEKKYDIAKLLIKYLSEDEIASEDGEKKQNIFHYVAQNPIPQDIFFLLAQACPKGLSKEDSKEVTPVHLSMAKNKFEMALLFIATLTTEQLNHTRIGSFTCPTLLHYAIFRSAPKEIYQALLRKCPLMSFEKRSTMGTPLEACINDNITTIEKRLEHTRYFIELLEGEEICKSVDLKCLTHLMEMAIDYLPTDTLIQLISKVPSILKVKIDDDQSPIEYAIKQNKIEQAKILIEASPQKLLEIINPKTGNNLLHIAADSGSEEILKLLIPKLPQHTNRYNNENETPIFRALVKGLSLDAITHLAESLSIDQLNEINPNTGRGLIHHAIAHKVSDEVLSYLIQKCPLMIHSRDKCTLTPLDEALLSRNAEAVKTLITALDKKQLLEKVRGDGRTFLHTAVYNEAVNAIHLLSEKCPELLSIKNRKGKTPLEFAFSKNKAKAIQTLIALISEEEASKEFYGCPTLIHYAAQHSDEPVLRQLIEKFPELANRIDKDGNTPLALAILGNKDANATLLIKMLSEDQLRLQVYKKGYTIAHLAAKHGNKQTLTDLISKIPKLFKVRDNKANRPLDLALKRSEDEITHAILNSTKSKHLRELHPKTQTTAIHTAAKKSSKSVFKKIVELAGPISSFRDCANNTPLISAIQGGNLNVLRLLTKTPSYSELGRLHPGTGKTALHYAAEQESEIFNTVLKAYTNTSIHRRSKTDETPLHIAIKTKSQSNALKLIKRLSKKQLEEQDLLTGNTVAHHTLLMSASQDTASGKTQQQQQVSIIASVVLGHILWKCPEIAFTKNSEGKTPLEIALESKDGDCLTSFLNSFLEAKDATKALTLIETIYPTLITKVGKLTQNIHFIYLLKYASADIIKKIIEKYPELIFVLSESNALVPEKSQSAFKDLIDLYPSEQLTKLTYKGKTIVEFCKNLKDMQSFLPHIIRAVAKADVDYRERKKLDFDKAPTELLTAPDKFTSPNALKALSRGWFSISDMIKMDNDTAHFCLSDSSIHLLEVKLLSPTELIDLVQSSSKPDLETIFSPECINSFATGKISKDDLLNLSSYELQKKLDELNQ